MRAFGAIVPSSCMIVGFPSLWFAKGELRLGERVCIESIGTLYDRGGAFRRCTFAVAPDASIEIGDETLMVCSSVHAREKVSIGKRVIIAGDCQIFDSDGHTVDAVPRKHAPVDDPKPVVIEDDVWLGCDVMVCKGVTIGKGSVIGAKSIVTHDIPPGVLAAGNPAQVIRPLRLADKA